jgi:type I restriction enzyme S subunit
MGESLEASAAGAYASQENRRPLPDGWRWVRLGDILRETRNGLYKPDQYYGRGVPILKMFNIGRLNGAWNLERLDSVELTEGEARTYRLDLDDILLNRVNSRELVGKSAVVDGSTTGAVFESKNMRLRLYRELASPAFVTYWINGADGRAQIERRLKQIVGQATINRSDLDGLMLPLPPLAEQRRIAAILAEQMAAVEQARAAVEDQMKTARDLRSAYLRTAFDGPGARDWLRLSIEDLIASEMLTYHQDGNHGELHPRNRDFVATGVKFVTAKHLRRDGSVALNEAPHISVEQAAGLRIGFAQGGDVLLAHNATVGPVGRVPVGVEPFVVGTSLTIYRTGSERLDPSFLFLALQSPDFQKQLTGSMEQTTRNQVPITQQRRLCLPLPEIDEQRHVVSTLGDQLTAVTRIRSAVEAQLTGVNGLPAALLRRAFAGEL